MYSKHEEEPIELESEMAKVLPSNLRPTHTYPFRTFEPEKYWHERLLPYLHEDLSYTKDGIDYGVEKVLEGANLQYITTQHHCEGGAERVCAQIRVESCERRDPSRSSTGG